MPSAKAGVEKCTPAHAQHERRQQTHSEPAAGEHRGWADV